MNIYRNITIMLAATVAGCCQGVTGVRLLEGVKSHDYVLRARVVTVGSSPGFWSGLFTAVQDVKYEVLDVYKGPDKLAHTQVLVHHTIVGGPLEDVTPRLNPKLFVVGKEAVLFVYKSYPGLEDGFYIYGDDPVGVIFLGSSGATADRADGILNSTNSAGGTPAL